MPKDESIPVLVTIGVIASNLGVSVDRVRYILRTRDYIKPRATAAGMRLFDSQAIVDVRHELNVIGSK